MLEVQVEHRRIAVDSGPAHVALDLGDADLLEDAGHLGKKVGVLDVEKAALLGPEVLDPEPSDHTRPVDIRSELLQLRHAHAACVHVALLRARRHGARERRLELHRVPSVLLGLSLRASRELHDVYHHRRVGLAVLFHLVRVLEVVRTVRHRDSSLRDEETVQVRVGVVGVNPPRPEDVDVCDRKLDDRLHQCAVVHNLLHFLQPRRNRSCSHLLDGRHVHTRAVELACDTLVLLERGNRNVFDILRHHIPLLRP
mmetsp:Transcript_47179/g.111236  ORF Transcript_47179/g.111236 Transcript_47179/m.111236 type:complete len:255 (-) Transcript_47179:457-1221(-)